MILKLMPKIRRSTSGTYLEVTINGKKKRTDHNFKNVSEAQLFLDELTRLIPIAKNKDLPFAFLPCKVAGGYRVSVRSTLTGKLIGFEKDKIYLTYKAAVRGAEKAYSNWFSDPSRYEIKLADMVGSPLTLKQDGLEYKLLFWNPNTKNTPTNQNLGWSLTQNDKLVGKGYLNQLSSGITDTRNMFLKMHLAPKFTFNALLSVINQFTPVVYAVMTTKQDNQPKTKVRKRVDDNHLSQLQILKQHALKHDAERLYTNIYTPTNICHTQAQTPNSNEPKQSDVTMTPKPWALPKLKPY